MEVENFAGVKEITSLLQKLAVRKFNNFYRKLTK